MGRVVRAFVAAIIVTLAWSFPVSAANAVPQVAPALYSYDVTTQVALRVATSERGRPGTYAPSIATHDADSLRSLGVSACPDVPTTPATYDYDDLGQFVQIAPPSGGVDRQVGSIEAGSVVVVRSGVAAKTAPNPCKLNSFTADTLVLMADGSKKPIKSVRLGDRVMATDPATGETGPRKVTDLIRHGGLHTMVAVRLADGTTIDATDRHPFWVESRGEWVDAIHLRPGHQVLTADGYRIAVVSVEIRAEDLTAYNLTVAGLHTYYAGVTSVLVHNDGYVPPPPGKVLDAFPDAQYVGRGSPYPGGYRARWVMRSGTILEWDYRHGAIEMWSKKGKHLGQFDPVTGAQQKPAASGRKLGGC